MEQVGYGMLHMKLTPNSVSLTVLAALLSRIAAVYQERGVVSTDLSDRDFYRVFFTDEMFDIYANVPDTIPVGSLYDDITELSKLLDDPERMTTPLDIERIGNVLRALSDAM
jgi:hypothetical protein